MNAALTRLFKDRGVENPELVSEVRRFFIKAMISSREFGKRTVGTMLSLNQEELVWNDVQHCFNELKESDNSIFAQQNLEALKQNYRIVRK